MVRVSFDGKYRVLLASFSATFVEADIATLAAAVADFKTREGVVRGLVDFTDVEVIDVTLAAMTRAAQERPQIMTGQDRVYVIPQALLFGMTRVFGTYQSLGGFIEPQIVRTMAEAYAALDLADPDFRPIEPWAAGC
jgi:hypothetical protein